MEKLKDYIRHKIVALQSERNRTSGWYIKNILRL